MFRVMKYNPDDSYTTISIHQNEAEAVRAAKRQAHLENVIFYVMRQHGLAVPSTVVDYKHS